ncbi:hypothetical protein RCH18_002372 [Flavobacterium sp. PL11]|nr:hypothetical protein [Flavobacterium sp. PL11]
MKIKIYISVFTTDSLDMFDLQNHENHFIQLSKCI